MHLGLMTSTGRCVELLQGQKTRPGFGYESAAMLKGEEAAGKVGFDARVPFLIADADNI